MKGCLKVNYWGMARIAVGEGDTKSTSSAYRRRYQQQQVLLRGMYPSLFPSNSQVGDHNPSDNLQ
ncbi:hypothetical protein SADUNF_Sadunf08G0072700 [Salix dunnii]|uniref:Uncharacterized protein n=1 Tax=Salix dunnii TaxID=1413687 RepID=A0A835JT90_9ROSI|nr:hypothetical protein SADUNF_Sadunf08G0072700 [Salix dunnii]